jgi:hypothetical protein
MKIRSNEITEKDNNLNTTNDLANVKIEAFDVVDHGIEQCQYFQGESAMFTRFDSCETGCGDTFADALDDALESLAQSDVEIDFDDLETRIKEFLGLKPSDPLPANTSASEWIEARAAKYLDADSDSAEGFDDCEFYYYVSIRYSLPKAAEGPK